jgi:hypothetical protein
MRTLRSLLLIAPLAVAVACGGGGGSNDAGACPDPPDCDACPTVTLTVFLPADGGALNTAPCKTACQEYGPGTIDLESCEYPTIDGGQVKCTGPTLCHSG